MKSAIAHIVFAAAAFAGISTNASAVACVADPKNPFECATEVPEPSSPLLFLAAAGVAGVVLKLRKKK